MKKILFIIPLFLIFLVSCNNTSYLEEALDILTFPDVIYDDLEFINSTIIDSKEITFTYKSNSSSLSNEGVITRSEHDVEVILNVTASYKGNSLTKDFQIIIPKIDLEYEEIIDKALEEIHVEKYLTEDIYLPTEITSNNKTLKFEWITNSNNLSETGVVIRGAVDEEIDIYVKVTIDDYTTIKFFKNVIVLKDIDIEYDYYVTDATLLSFDYNLNTIELTNTQTTKINSSFRVYYNYGNSFDEAPYEELMIGLKDLLVYIKDDTVTGIVIDADFRFTEIRVAIRKSINDIADESTLYHDSISFTLMKNTYVSDISNITSYELKSGTVIVTYAGGYINVSNNGNSYNFSSRIIIHKTTSQVKINTISRGGDLLYYGDMDISIVKERLLLINQVDMDEYLKKVVPSEMPSSWNLEALKAQAVAARTYAYMEFYNKKYLELGYVVDDSTSSQVYNNQNQAARSTQAVNETSGVVMFYKDKPIIAYYYSSSCGLTSSGNEVWIQDSIIDEIGYLKGKNLSTLNGQNIVVDTSSEEAMLEFFKLINFTNPGGNSSLHRWKITFTKTQLKNTINANIKTMSNTYKTSYPILEGPKEFPDDIGDIEDIYVSERGSSGVVVSITIVTNKLTFKIINQYNIRFTIRAKDCGSTVNLYSATSSKTTYTSTTKNPSVLNSGFFALEWNNDELTFYGGGNGHGVGMDQYGANYYASIGYTYQDILKTYYTDIDFIYTYGV